MQIRKEKKGCRGISGKNKAGTPRGRSGLRILLQISVPDHARQVGIGDRKLNLPCGVGPQQIGGGDKGNALVCEKEVAVLDHVAHVAAPVVKEQILVLLLLAQLHNAVPGKNSEIRSFGGDVFRGEPLTGLHIVASSPRTVASL